MSTADIKNRISKMKRADQDDVMEYILSLRYSDNNEISEHCKRELDERKNSFEKGEMSLKPLNELLDHIDTKY